MKKFIIIAISLLFLSATCKGQTSFYSSFKQWYLQNELRTAIKNNTFYLYSHSDTVSISLTSQRDLRYAKKVHKYAQKQRQLIRQDLTNLFQYEVTPEVKLPHKYVKGFFIMSQADSNLLDNNKHRFSALRPTRTSVTTFGGNYYDIYRYRITIPFTGSGYDSTNYNFMRDLTSSKVHYLVPFECTLDSLRNYINNPNSKPKWAGEINP